MRRMLFLLLYLTALLLLPTGCSGAETPAAEQEETPEAASETETATEEAGEAEEVAETEETAEAQVEEVETMLVQVGESTFTATLEDNQAVDELVALLEEAPITLQMRDYSGFEKVGALGESLTTDNSQTTTQSGDIVLYQGDQIVLFYGSNSWSYTRLGHVQDLTGWEEALGSGDVTVTLSLEG